MKVESYSVEGPIKGLVKQHTVWAQEASCMAPLIYLQRPKWTVNDAQWLVIVNSVRLELPADFEVGGL